MAYKPPENQRLKHSFSPTNPTPAPEKYDSTPVRRTYKERTPESMVALGEKSGYVKPRKEQPLSSAGPLHNLPPIRASALLAPISSHVIHPAPSVVEGPRSKTQLGYIRGVPGGHGKNAPARARAGHAQRPNSQSNVRMGGHTDRDSGASPLPSSWLGDISQNFEVEMAERGGILSAMAPPESGDVQESVQRSGLGPSSTPPQPAPTPDPNTKPVHVPYAPDLRSKQTHTSVHTHSAPKKMVLRDYMMLAEACQRAGKARMEGHAYYKIGEIHAANPDTRHKAVINFTKYLNICRRLNDLQGEAKALNCLGITCHEMGGQENLTQALNFHRQHSEVADAAGVFISHTNMGLIHAELGTTGKAIDCYKIALQYAVRAGDKQAESLALAHLGKVERNHGDLATAKVCLDRHVELATTLKDTPALCYAQEQLGVLAIERKDYATAVECFTQALEVALQSNDQAKASELRCQLGFAKGMEGVTAHVSEVSESMGVKHRK